MESKKIIHIHLKDQSLDGKSDWYFGSIAAIYEKMNHCILGVKENTLYNYLWHRGGEYENERCKISQGEIVRKSNSRSKK